MLNLCLGSEVFIGPNVYIALGINLLAMTCADLDLIGIANTTLAISQVATNRYLRPLKPFSMNFMLFLASTVFFK